MEHNFHHHPNATYAVLLIMFMVYNLFCAYPCHYFRYPGGSGLELGGVRKISGIQMA